MILFRPILWFVFGVLVLGTGLSSQAQYPYDLQEIRNGKVRMVQDFKREYVIDFTDTKDSIGAYVKIAKWSNQAAYSVSGASLAYSRLNRKTNLYYGVQLPVTNNHQIRITEQLQSTGSTWPDGTPKYRWPAIRVSDPIPLCINRAWTPVHPLHKETFGMDVPLNINDSDEDNIPDDEDIYIEGDDPELVAVRIRHPQGLPIQLDWDNDIIHLYERSSKKYGYTATSRNARVGANIGNDPYKGYDDEIVYVEGIAPGSTFLTVTGPGNIEDRIKISILKVDLIPDYNHDRKIDSEDETFADQNLDFCFWVNDDDDSGDTGGSDVPGEGTLDWQNNQVDGVRDLVDFFPVFIDLKDTLDLLGTTDFKYVLKHQSAALKFFYTDLTPATAGGYQTIHSLAEGPEYSSATVEEITSAGIELPTTFLNKIKDEGKGIILVEAEVSTVYPLTLEVVEVSSGNAVCTEELPLKVAGVENMYWRGSLRPVVPGGNPPTLVDATSLPDSALLSDKRFVFIHGYSVNETQARGWLSEVFKRMYWSGSLARFYGITWFGNDSQQMWLGGNTPDYHVNVVHALDSAEAFASFLDNQVGGDITLAAHSLGNVVSAAAVATHSASVARFFMIDGALAIEAFDSTPSAQSVDMVHLEWDGYDDWLWCSEWHENFPVGDGRREMTWRDRFLDAADVAYNFYSSGEDVLKTHPHSNSPGLWDYASGQYAWALQEKRKGRNWITSIGGSTYGGWGFNSHWDVFDVELEQWIHLPPAEANEIFYGDILANPFFRPGGEELAPLYPEGPGDPDPEGSQFAEDNLHFLLGGFVPSRTLPVGANHVAALDAYGARNFDMQAQFKDGWPNSRGSNTDWLHSDLRVISYVYIYELYDKFKDLGGLDQ